MTSSHTAVELFSTSILSNHKIRSRHERYISILTIKKIPYIYHDLASDEEAKSRWRRKARDQQIPGLLVHNEWRGTFEEFEESIEFGELDLFLKIDPLRAQHDAQLNGTAASGSASSSTTPSETIGSSADSFVSASSSKAPGVSHSVKSVARLAQPKAPSQSSLAPALPFAPAGTGKWKDHDAESFLTSLGISDLNLTEEELNEILDAGKSSSVDENAPSKTSNENSVTAPKYPNSLGIGTLKPPVQRTYIPSADAGVRPLQLSRMGHDDQRSSSSSISPLRINPSARYDASQTSSKARAAEAQASISSRSFSSVRLRDAVSKGDKLQDAFRSTKEASGIGHKEHIVGREDLDELMSSLGLNDVEMTEEEAEAFLLDGSIPSGLDTHGSRVKVKERLPTENEIDTAALNNASITRSDDIGSKILQRASRAPEVGTSILAPKVGVPIVSGEGPFQAVDVSEDNGEKPVEEKISPILVDGKKGVDFEANVTKGDTVKKSDGVANEIEETEYTLPQDSFITPETDTIKDHDEDEASQMKDTNDTSIDSCHSITGSNTAVDLAKTTAASKNTADPEVEATKSLEVKDEPTSDQPERFQSKREASPDMTALESSSLLADQVKSDSDSADVSNISVEIAPTDAIDKDAIIEKTSTVDSADTLNADEATEKKTPNLRPVPLHLEEHASNFSALESKGKTKLESSEKEVGLSEADETPMQADSIKDEITPTIAKLEPAHIIDKPSAVLDDLKSIPLPPSAVIPASPPIADIPAVEFASPTTIPSSPSAIAAFPSSPPNPANLSPVIARRRESSSNSRSSSSRKAMDLPRRQSSSNSVLSDTSIQSPQLGTSPVMSPKGSEGRKSPMNGAKKFFGGLGRRKGRSSSTNSKRSGEDEDEEEEAEMSPNTSFDPGQKRISAILREADAAMEGLEDESIENSHDSIMSHHAFNTDRIDEITKVTS